LSPASPQREKCGEVDSFRTGKGAEKDRTSSQNVIALGSEEATARGRGNQKGKLNLRAVEKGGAAREGPRGELRTNPLTKQQRKRYKNQGRKEAGKEGKSKGLQRREEKKNLGKEREKKVNVGRNEGGWGRERKTKGSLSTQQEGTRSNHKKKENARQKMWSISRTEENGEGSGKKGQGYRKGGRQHLKEKKKLRRAIHKYRVACGGGGGGG